MAIRVSLGRADFVLRPDEVARAVRITSLVKLPVRAEVTARVMDPPLHYRDPIDSLPVAQAIVELMRLYTADSDAKQPCEHATTFARCCAIV